MAQQQPTMMDQNGLGLLARSVFNKENLNQASTFAKAKAGELHQQAQDGDHSLRFLALVGGVALIVVGCMECFGRLARFNIVGALIQIYTVLIGVIIVTLEGKSMLLPASFQARLYKYALFLKYLWGRGAMYFMIGTLQLYQFDLFNLITGGYMCAVGALYGIVGWRTARKLKNLRTSLFTQEQLHTQFAQADVDGDGGLSLPQFRNVATSLGLDMTRREIEAAFSHIKKSDQEKLSYDEFVQWWNTADTEDDFVDSKYTSFV